MRAPRGAQRPPQVKRWYCAAPGCATRPTLAWCLPGFSFLVTCEVHSPELVGGGPYTRKQLSEISELHPDHQLLVPVLPFREPFHPIGVIVRIPTEHWRN